MGWHWYADKHVLIIWATIGLGLIAMPVGREFLLKFVRTKMIWICLAAFLIGLSPEIAYKMGFVASRAERTTDSESFLKLAGPDMLAHNWYMLFRVIPMYFDADPWARALPDIHYVNHLENWESFPLYPVDTIGLIAAFLVISYVLHLCWQSYKERNLPVFMLAVCPFMNLFMVLVASRSAASYYRIQQYIYPAGVLFALWLGVRLGQDWVARKWATCAVLGLLLAISLYHQMILLDLPDVLADYKATVADIEAQGYQYGLSFYSYSHTLTALSDEKVQFGIVDRTFQSPYQNAATNAETVAIVWPATSPVPFEAAQKMIFGAAPPPDNRVRAIPDQLTFFGSTYERIGERKFIGELGWAPYRKQPPK
jgi:hypothetical protein